MTLTKTDEFVLAAMRKFAAAGTLGNQQDAVVTVADVIDELTTACQALLGLVDYPNRMHPAKWQDAIDKAKEAIAKADGK